MPISEYGRLKTSSLQLIGNLTQLKEDEMAEEKYKVNTYEIDYKCDACRTGYMRPLGTVLLSNPAQYPHRCNNCGAEMIVREHIYPYMVTEKVSE